MYDHKNAENKPDLKANLDLSNLRPYGDSMNDGKVQLSFTLPVEESAKTVEAARLLAIKMGLDNPIVVYHESLDKGFTFFIIYGNLKYSINYSEVKVETIDLEIMSINEINDFIKNNIDRKIKVLGASTGTDAHTLGIDAIMNIKGYHGHLGLEGYEMIETYNMGAQVLNEDFVRKAIEIDADVLLISQTVTEKNIHIENLTNLVDLLEAEEIRSKVILICGGARIGNKLAKELGYDAGFGPETTSEVVASYFVKELLRRKNLTFKNYET